MKRGVDRPLTIEEKKLIEKNHKLVYGFMHSNKIPMDDYDVYALRLIMATQKYDGRVKFSTYIYKCLRNEMINQARINKKIGDKEISIQHYFRGNGDDGELQIEDTMGVDDICMQDVEISDEVSRFCEILSEAEKKVFSVAYTQGECNYRLMGMSRQRVQVLREQIKKKYIRWCENEGACKKTSANRGRVRK